MNVISKMNYIVALGLMASASVMAFGSNVSFTGSVTNTTCDVHLEVNGAPASVVNLGRAVLGRPPVESPVVSFRLKPDPTQAGCVGLTSQDVVTITFVGNFSTRSEEWGVEGMLSAQSGDALDTGVLMTYTSPSGVFDFIHGGHLNISLDGKSFLNEGADLKAFLISGKLTGTFQAAAAYVVSYN
ncbi:hypothetical protein H8I69_05985 [Serratia fonticola]|uniref:hypothetical protein n=1 Tax=Serratia fonticola TaxID=47917 RepID=UPI0015C63633|nr:hypothetical protein [Serratia fonticola]MBC3378667.1 hypothetical protein [Serratia fonticola]NYA37867.1 hypothetical protein [Serratia fonticola]